MARRARQDLGILPSPRAGSEVARIPSGSVDSRAGSRYCSPLLIWSTDSGRRPHMTDLWSRRRRGWLRMPCPQLPVPMTAARMVMCPLSSGLPSFGDSVRSEGRSVRLGACFATELSSRSDGDGRHDCARSPPAAARRRSDGPAGRRGRPAGPAMACHGLAWGHRSADFVEYVRQHFLRSPLRDGDEGLARSASAMRRGAGLAPTIGHPSGGPASERPFREDHDCLAGVRPPPTAAR
jgi:hypothetical protein